MATCPRKKLGEFNWLRCCREEGHEGTCNWVVDFPPPDSHRLIPSNPLKIPKKPMDENEYVTALIAAAKQDERERIAHILSATPCYGGIPFAVVSWDEESDTTGALTLMADEILEAIAPKP